jgi:hypothetical protein
MVERWVYLGNAVQLIVRLATGAAVQVLIQNTGDEIPYSQGSPVHAHFPVEVMTVLSPIVQLGQPARVQDARWGAAIATCVLSVAAREIAQP